MVRVRWKKYDPKTSIYDQECEQLHNQGRNVYTYTPRVLIAATSAATEIIGTSNFTTSLRGNTSAMYFQICSSSSSDISSGSNGATTVKFIGIDSAYNIRAEECSLDETAGVSTENSYVELIDGWITGVGSAISGASAPVGTITWYNDGGSTAYMTIPATKQNLSATRMSIPPNWACHVHKTFISNGGALSQMDSDSYAINIYPDYDDFQYIENPVLEWIGTRAAKPREDTDFFTDVYEPTVQPASVVMYEQCDDSGALGTFNIGIQYLLYPKNDSLSSTQETGVVGL